MKRSPEERAALEAAKCDRERTTQRATLDALTPQNALGVAMPSRPGPSDPSTLDIGTAAEDRAVDLLIEHGYIIVDRNYKAADIGELDIVAIDGDTLAFIEVRSRADDEHGDAIETISRRKRRMVTRAAELYLADRRPDFDEFRFDVVAINGDEIDLYQDAWRGGLL